VHICGALGDGTGVCKQKFGGSVCFALGVWRTFGVRGIFGILFHNDIRIVRVLALDDWLGLIHDLFFIALYIMVLWFIALYFMVLWFMVLYCMVLELLVGRVLIVIVAKTRQVKGFQTVFGLTFCKHVSANDHGGTEIITIEYEIKHIAYVAGCS
jgi:hypothetical protein